MHEINCKEYYKLSHMDYLNFAVLNFPGTLHFYCFLCLKMEFYDELKKKERKNRSMVAHWFAICLVLRPMAGLGFESRQGTIIIMNKK